MSDTQKAPTRSRRDTRNRRGRFAGLSAEERRAARRQLLVEAGLQRFGTDGFHAVGVRQLCAEAGLTERYFYESFDSREALFRAVYDEVLQRIRRHLEAAAGDASSDPFVLVRTVLGAYMAQLRDDPRLVRVGLIEVHAIDDALRDHARAMNRSFTDLIVPTVLARCPELPELGYDAQLVADGLLGSTLFLVTEWATGGFRTPPEAMLDHCALHYEALLDTLDGGLTEAGRAAPDPSRTS